MIDPKYPTIGVLLDSHLYSGMYPSVFASTVIRGIQSAARDLEANLLIACGMQHGSGPSRFRPAWPDPGEGMDFVPVGPWNTDGLIVFSPLRSENRIRYVGELSQAGFPLVFIGSGTGTPMIAADNEGGIRQALEHLVGHGHRDIAFIAGDPEDPGDSLARIVAFREGVQAFGLNADPRLIACGRHWDEAAYRAVQQMLESGVKFTAVMCSNDQSALGVVRALDEAGLRIPWDVAVTGFDDQPEALSVIPPLTSVHYPLIETGYRALLMLRNRIVGGAEASSDVVRVATQLIPRQSCGCLSIDTPEESSSGTVPPHRSEERLTPADLTQAMTDALLSRNAVDRAAERVQLCGRLVGAFLQSVREEDVSPFQVALTEILKRIELQTEDPHAWQAAISVLRLSIRSPLAGGPPPNPRLAEDLLHRARMLLSDSARRRFLHQQLVHAYQEEAVGLLTARMLSSLEETLIYAALAESLPDIGIRSAQVFYFEPDGDDPYAGSRLPLEGTRFPGLRFETRRFPPRELRSGSAPFQFAILPFFFQEERLGYMAFEAEDFHSLAMIVIQLSAAVKSAQLHARVRELSLSDALTGVSNRRFFEILIDKESRRSRRYGRPLALIAADIDRFREYNDAFGHPAGDQALREIARCFREEARRSLDVVARCGGEEFAVLLPETDAAGALLIAQRIRRRIAADARFLRPVTVSFGVAGTGEEGADPQALIDRADRALCQAKNQGRDRCVLFEEWMGESAHSILGEE
jgi:diguanylate cyclase (GGDEF)-like protein